MRQNHNIYLLDGGEDDDRGGAGGMSIAPSSDAIAEFRALTSNYSADYGLSSGGTMTMVLKSGTRHFMRRHGNSIATMRLMLVTTSTLLRKQVAEIAPECVWLQRWRPGDASESSTTRSRKTNLLLLQHGMASFDSGRTQQPACTGSIHLRR